MTTTQPEVRFTERLAFLLKRSQLLFARRHVEVLERHGLGEKEFALLSVIAAEPGRSQRRLGEALYIDRTTIVALVDGLERAGLVARERAPEDRRMIAVRPTAEGARRLAAATADVAAAEEDFLACVPAADRAVLRAALALLVEERSE